ncbi:hypothetical protein [Trueperella pyogenes]|uniref:hypothetical protein n=1 Tax=Trueperella pyogenes TaxID=1661 RepID=UPI00345D16A2
MDMDKARLRAAHLKTGRPVTREGQRIAALHQCMIGAAVAMERESKGTLFEPQIAAYGDYLRRCLQTVNEIVMAMELMQ